MAITNVMDRMLTPTIDLGEDIDYKTSLTIPDQSMSIREIIQRFSSGGNIDRMAKPVYYDGLDDYDQADPTLRGDFDLSDATAISQEIADRLKEKEEAKIEAERKRSEIEAEKLAASLNKKPDNEADKPQAKGKGSSPDNPPKAE